MTPKIEPFTFADDLRQGLRTRLLCGVSQGDLPMQISWYKDGQPLVHLPAVTLKELDTFSSVLTFSNLSAVHKGYYQCVAHNGAGIARYGTHLSVQGECNLGARAYLKQD